MSKKIRRFALGATMAVAGIIPMTANADEVQANACVVVADSPGTDEGCQGRQITGYENLGGSGTWFVHVLRDGKVIRYGSHVSNGPQAGLGTLIDGDFIVKVEATGLGSFAFVGTPAADPTE